MPKEKTPDPKNNVTIWPIRKKVEIAPGKNFVTIPPENVPTIAIAKLVPQGDGTYKAIASIQRRYVRLTRDLPSNLGIGVDYNTLKRLIISGFVRGGKVSPSAYYVDIISVFEHVEKCFNDPEYWTKQRLLSYKRAIG